MSIPFQIVLHFTLFWYNGGHRDSLFIVYLLFQTVQDNNEKPTNSYDVIHSVLVRELICYARLIKAPKNPLTQLGTGSYPRIDSVR